MKFIVLLSAIFLIYESVATNDTCQFTPFEGACYALIPTNSDWFTSETACTNCGAQTMPMPNGTERAFVDQTLGANVESGTTAWVNIQGSGWCSFYTIKSNKQFFGTNCMIALPYVLCKKNP